VGKVFTVLQKVFEQHPCHVETIVSLDGKFSVPNKSQENCYQTRTTEKRIKREDDPEEIGAEGPIQGEIYERLRNRQFANTK
jgi:queuine/archaeosine tRNA-ribosyltransferase